MIGRLRARASALVLLPVLFVLLAGGVAAAAETAPTYTKENLSEYEAQLKGGQIQSVIVNKRLRSLRITLNDGSHVFVKYGKKEGPKYYAAITARHIPLRFLSAEAAKKEQEKASKHHKIRYIAGAVLIVALVIAAVVLFTRRRNREED